MQWLSLTQLQPPHESKDATEQADKNDALEL